MIVLAGRNLAKMEAAKAELDELGVESYLCKTDIADRAQVQALADYAASLGDVLQVIHTSGVSPSDTATENIIKINAVGTVNMVEAFYPVLAEGGVMINFSSVAAYTMPQTDEWTQAFEIWDRPDFFGRMLALAGEAEDEEGEFFRAGLAYALGESFMAENPNVTFTYNPTGSGSGIQAVSEGRCDIGLSSRALKDEEKASGLKETTLALDGIAIIVNPENPVSDLDVETIAKIYTGEITNWKDVGGNDAEIVLIGREAGSGTRDGFESITGTKDACQYRQELTSTGDVIATVAQNPDAIGYASLSAVKDTVKALTVGGVAPSEDTVKDGSYVVQRPFVLVTKDGEALSEAAQAFYDYALDPAQAELIGKAGAVAVN